jgi:hypothetical protein
MGLRFAAGLKLIPSTPHGLIPSLEVPFMTVPTLAFLTQGDDIQAVNCLNWPTNWQVNLTGGQVVFA